MKKILCLLILIAILTLPLTSCGYLARDRDTFSTYEKFIEYVEDFEKHSNSNLTGVFFDLDSESSALNKTYYAAYIVTEYYLLGDLYQPIDYSLGMNFELLFYMDDAEHTDDDSQYPYSIFVYSKSYIPDDINESGKFEISGDISNSEISDSIGLDEGYYYMNVFDISVGNVNVATIVVRSVQELTEEKVETIYQLLINNIVFYR